MSKKNKRPLKSAAGGKVVESSFSFRISIRKLKQVSDTLMKYRTSWRAATTAKWIRPAAAKSFSRSSCNLLLTT